MKTLDFDYTLPKELIANSPADPRDHSNLMIVDRSKYTFSHSKRSEESTSDYLKVDKFFNLPNYLTPNDVLVFNNTKVFPARIFGSKNGKLHEVLLLSHSNSQQSHPELVSGSHTISFSHSNSYSNSNTWSCLIRGKIAINDTLSFGKFLGKVLSKENGTYSIKFSIPYPEFLERLYEIGNTPIPPYIHSTLTEKKLREKYQTIYAKDEGSAAAPTAGLHFTQELINQLTNNGVQLEYVTLHVGLGTFAPVREENMKDHQIHTEEFSVDPETIKRLNNYKKEGRRIIAVGTTTTRVLETLALSSVDQLGQLEIRDSKSSTELFIYPPFKFNFVDAMITNFHLPKSTLLALVCAFVSKPNTNHKFTTFFNSLIGEAYQKAIEENFRFFSFGDAMLIR